MSSQEEIDEINRILDKLVLIGREPDEYKVTIRSSLNRENFPSSYVETTFSSSNFVYKKGERIERPIKQYATFLRKIRLSWGSSEILDFSKMIIAYNPGSNGPKRRKTFNWIYAKGEELKKDVKFVI